MDSINRRSFLASTAAASLPIFASASEAKGQSGGYSGPGGPVAISSANGREAINKAMLELREGVNPAQAAVDGIALVENDAEDMSVGLGGLPNVDGVL